MTPSDLKLENDCKIKLNAVADQNKENHAEVSLKRLAYLLGKNAAIMDLKETNS